MADRIPAVQDKLAAVGLQNMGCFGITPQDGLPLETGTVMLIGPDEPSFWGYFSASPHITDGQADPLDRWSRDMIDPIAAWAKGHALYPFGGPPYHPFHTWAVRTGQAWASPIGFLVHRVSGLFASYRAALLLPWQTATPPPAQPPCDTCAAQPCKSACPVDAFADGYAVTTCKSHLRTAAGADCMARGCAARRSCPVGQGRRPDQQAAFHMESFL